MQTVDSVNRLFPFRRRFGPTLLQRVFARVLGWFFLILAFQLFSVSAFSQAVRIFDRLDKQLDVSIASPASGQILSYNGSKWINSTAASGLPDQTGNSGKYLTTNGTSASWITLSLAGYQTTSGTLALGGFSSITGTVPRANLPTIPAANIARVDPAGNNTTGTIGDFGKPFLTMQAAISAIEALNTDGLINGQIAVVDIGNNDFSETITTPLHNLAIQGFHGDYDTISGITFSAATGQVNLMFFGLSIGNVTVATTGLVSVKVERGFSPNIIAPNCSIVSVISKTGTVLGNDIVAKGDVYVSGIVNDVSIQSTEGSVIIQGGSAFSSIFAPAATDIQAAVNVTVTRTRVGDVTCGGTLTLIDSRVVGTNSASSTVYADVMLTGDDTAYDATSWNGNTGVPTKNAVRDKIESLGGGTVTNFSAGDLSPLFTTSEATTTTTPALTFTLSTHTANTVFAGPTTGSAAAPTFRALVSGDIPDLSATYQPKDTDLTTWAGITPGTGVGTALAINVGTSGAFVTNGGALGTPSSGNGSNLTALNGSEVTSGTIAPARLGSGSGGSSKFLREDSTFQTIGGGGDALVANPLSQFASTTSAQLRGVLSDELGTGVALFDGATPTSFVLTNATGSPTGISLTLAQLNTIVSDDDVAGLAAANTFTGANINSKSGAASTPAMKYSGVPFAGTGTTSFPLVYLNDANATASTTLATAGTYLGVNGHGTADLANLLLDGTSKFKVTSTGAVTTGSDITAGSSGTVSGLNLDVNGGKARLSSDGSTGDLILKSGGANAFNLLIFGLASASGSGISTSGINAITLTTGVGGATWNDATTANSGTVANRYLFGIAAPTLTSTGTSVTNTVASTVYIGGAPTASTNTTITTPYAFDVAAGVSNFGGPLVVAASYTVATLPSTAATGKVTGSHATVTDGDASLAWGATVINSGSGATKYLVWYNGTNWTVLGK